MLNKANYLFFSELKRQFAERFGDVLQWSWRNSNASCGNRIAIGEVRRLFPGPVLFPRRRRGSAQHEGFNPQFARA